MKFLLLLLVRDRCICLPGIELIPRDPLRQCEPQIRGRKPEHSLGPRTRILTRSVPHPLTQDPSYVEKNGGSVKADLLGPDSTISISVLGWNSPTNCEALPKRSQNPHDSFCHLDPNRQNRKGRDRTISLATSSSQACLLSPHILAILLLSWKRRTCIREEDAENNKRMPVQCGSLGRFFLQGEVEKR